MRARCTWCGEIRITVDSLRCGLTEDRSVALCEFECPSCGRLQFHRTTADRAAMFVLSGAQRAGTRMPFELLEEHVGPAINWDDVLDLRIALGISAGTAVRGAGAVTEAAQTS